MNIWWILLAGFLSSDRRNAFNSMISRPIVVSLLIGLFHGNINWCFLGGIFFELIGLMDLPVGTHLSKDDTFGAFCYSYIIVIVTTQITLQYAFLAIIISFILMYPVTAAALYTRNFNRGVYNYYKRRKSGIAGNEGKMILIGQLSGFIRGALIYTLAATVGLILHNIIVSNLILKNVTLSTIVAITLIYIGYFSGFFYSIFRTKFIVFVLGVLVGWFIL